MEGHISLFVVLGLVITTVAAQSCPTGCICPRPGHVSCTGLSSFPKSFPASTEVVTIYLSSLPEIPPDSFKGLPLLNTVSLYKNTIGKIRNCAFKNLAQMKSLNIYQSNIDTIESGAFSNMSFVNPGSFSLYSITIGDIKPYAFSSLSDSRFSIYSANITIIRSFAFHNISAKSFSLYLANIDFMDTSAFEDFNGTKSASIYSSYIANTHCNTLDVLQEDVGNVFSFYQLTFNCSCQLAWLFEAAQTNLNLAASLNRNRCHNTSTVFPGRRLDGLNATLLCPGGRESSQCLKPKLQFPSQCPLPGAPTQSPLPGNGDDSSSSSSSNGHCPHVLGFLLTLVTGVFLKNQLR
ncbi:slit homolog 1 protein-like [Haliotis rubra]|uniref:slit homolog 1 protein-like n=1 Tax=Haliotis rubra TaxID=36100 RepID=UPI001EE59BFE|nr:slit homolog 1 protein-like [Haliotis rubra]